MRSIRRGYIKQILNYNHVWITESRRDSIKFVFESNTFNGNGQMLWIQVVKFIFVYVAIKTSSGIIGKYV